MITDSSISNIRMLTLGLTGLCCLLYGLLAILQNTPQPFWWFLPALMGVSSAAVIMGSFFMAKPSARDMATDEMYRLNNLKASSNAYWIVVMMYLVFAVLKAVLGLGWNTVFAAMGTLTGATYLLLSVYFERRAS